jgi:hypothetical protein
LGCLSLACLTLSLIGCESPPAAPPQAVAKLSAGTALPQPGPEGTLMMFSVDYRFREGAPDPAAKYVWVLEPAKGEPLEQPVKLRRQDTLQAIVPRWRPENGPFKSRIDEIAADGSRRNLAPPVDMR